MSFDIGDKDGTIFKLGQYIAEIQQWMANNFLQLNASKTEVLLFGTKHILNKFQNLSLSVWSEMITTSNSARNIGAILTLCYQWSNKWTKHAKGHGITYEGILAE